MLVTRKAFVLLGILLTISVETYAGQLTAHPYQQVLSSELLITKLGEHCRMEAAYSRDALSLLQIIEEGASNWRTKHEVVVGEAILGMKGDSAPHDQEAAAMKSAYIYLLSTYAHTSDENALNCYRFFKKVRAGAFDFRYR